MRAHDGRIGHQPFQVGIVGTENEEGFKDVLFTPTRKALVDDVPLARKAGNNCLSLEGAGEK